MNVFLLIVIYFAFLLSCSGPEELRYETFTDLRDGKEYKIIAIGSQTWIAENLNYDAPSSKCYKDDPENCEKYGRLYNWAASLNVCPDGWHLPTDAEWRKLTDYAGRNALDDYGFSVLPSGYYDSSYYSSLKYLDEHSLWWSSIDGGDDGSSALVYIIYDSYIHMLYVNKSSLIPVRCLKGKYSFSNGSNSNSNSSNAIYGKDLLDERSPQNPATYKTVVIGTQTWMAENLNYNVLGSKCYNNYPGNCERYGRLYNWEMAMMVCPDGWHLPSNEEWAILKNFAGSNSGTKLKAASGWNWNDWDGISGNGTDDYGFSALPSGPGGPDGDFSYGGNFAYWWSSTKRKEEENVSYWDVYAWGFAYKDTNINIRETTRREFQSVRCIKE